MNIISNVIYIGINKQNEEFNFLKVTEEKTKLINDAEFNIALKEKLIIITHDIYRVKMLFEAKGIENKILDSRELLAVLEPWHKEFDIDFLFEELTTISLDVVEAEKTYYIVESAIRRLWQSEENKKQTLYKLLVTTYNLKNKWNWIDYLEKPIFFNDENNFTNYREKKNEEIVYEGDISYSKYEALLRETQIWNAGGMFPYKYREEQERMSLKIRENIEKEERIFIEAPTGSGKSFAYLLIAILKSYLNSFKNNREDATFIISTDTKELQNQLISKDIPNIISKLRLNGKVTYGAMKGKSNYVCTEKLNKYSKLYIEVEEALGEVLLKRLCMQGKYGEIESINHYLIKHFKLEQIINDVRCNNDECKLEKCGKACYLRKRYKELQSENITVINHSLLATWPYAEKRKITHLIIDEAHNLMEKCYDFYSEEFDSVEFINMLQSLIKKHPTIYNEFNKLNASYGYRENIDLKKMTELQADVEKSINNLLVRARELKLVYGEYNFKTEFYLCGNELQVKMKDIGQYISIVKSEIYKLYNLLNTYFNNITIDGEEGKDDNEYMIISGFILKLKSAFDVIDAFLQDTKDFGKVFEVYKEYDGFKITNIPLKVSEIFNEITLKDVKSVTYLSATMRVENSFNKIKNFLGQKDARELVLPGIFDLKNRTKIFNMIDVGKYNTKEFIKNTSQFIFEISKRTNGHILALFTNNNRRDAVEKELKAISSGTKLEIYTNKSAIKYLRDKNKNVVILGSKTFFEGIDVVGEGLTTVILDKLPNKSIDDPLLKAITTYEKKSYREVNYPQLCIKVKQGYGRLIRSVIDYGYFCILDGGGNKFSLRELERDLCGPKFINASMKKVIEDIEKDYYNWSKDKIR